MRIIWYDARKKRTKNPRITTEEGMTLRDVNMTRTIVRGEKGETVLSSRFRGIGVGVYELATRKIWGAGTDLIDLGT